jgi:flagellar hook-associated protein 1 FlgK
MTIQGAFLSSLTSLNAQQAEITLISNNVANANTSGYSSQEYNPSAIIYGGQGEGVDTGTIQRVTNATLSAAANQANSASSYSGTITSALSGYSSSLTTTTSAADSVSGTATTTNVLSSAMSGLQSALTALSATPGSTTTQTSAVEAAQTVVSTFNSLDSEISTARETADSNVNTEVNSVNTALNQLSANESAIQKATALGQSTASLLDTRDQLVGTISQYIPVNVLNNTNGSISLTTDGGTTLYNNGTVDSLSFTPTQSIPDTLGVTANASEGITAGLSEVTVNGNPIQMSNTGSIAANLQLRDNILPQFSEQLNELAGNVINQFQTSDPSVSAGETGLFTASGSAITSSTPVAGLAGQISLNAAVDPDQGGSVWKIQSGVQATTQGLSSDTSIVNDFISGMSATQSFSAASGVAATDMVSASAQIAGSQQEVYATWSSTSTTQASQLVTAKTALSSSTGVNVDEQMQKLLLVQQTYAASAQIIQAANQMLSTINSIANTATG